MLAASRRVPRTANAKPVGAHSCLVSGVEILDIGERHQLIEPVRGAPGDRFEQKPDMIARIDSAQDVTGEPSDGIGENREVHRSRPPCTTVEFVDPMTSFTAEQPCQVLVCARQQMNSQML